MIYLDNSATTRACDAAAQSVMRGMQEDFYNPSSMYGPAVETERQIESARRRLSAAMDARSDELIFTGGGTESDNIAVFGTNAVLRTGKWRFITTQMEHAAVYQAFAALEEAGREVIYIRCNESGQVDLDELSAMVNERTALVSIMHVNNEFGSIADLSLLRAIIKRANPGTVFHSDGVQAFGKLRFAPVYADLYSISAHKFHGPKGVGALMMRRGVKNGGGQVGGGQESGLRSGTVNTAGILGMGAAFDQAHQHQDSNVRNMQQCKLRLASHLLQLPDVVVNGPLPQEGAPHILNLSFGGIRGEVMLHALEEKHIYVSTGSACSSHRRGPNRVLAAIGVTGERSSSAVRFSLCPNNTLEEMDIVADVIYQLIRPLRRYQRR